jgi:microcystin-dependent protein
MEQYLGEIRLFAGNFAPADWAFCNGQLLPISENDALFYLLGTTYGGDGQTTFGLPNLQSRAVVGVGQGPGLSNNYVQGQALGQETVTLTANQLPSHTHPVTATLQAHTGAPNQDSPEGAFFGDGGGRSYGPNNGSAALGANSVTNAVIGVAGSSQPHENRQPSLALNYIIALTGIFPSQP